VKWAHLHDHSSGELWGPLLVPREGHTLVVAKTRSKVPPWKANFGAHHGGSLLLGTFLASAKGRT
jgi:hypothetical protein